jgi:hypothetical protein
MPTAACGISCDVCKLNLLGTCSTCGPGNSPEAEKKLAAQQRLLGSPCPILACANLNHVQYCLRDCNQFPCDNFSTGPYPYSQGYLVMQKRRRKELPPAVDPKNSRVSVSPDYWDELQEKDINSLANLTLFAPLSDSQLSFQFLNEEVLVDLKKRCLMRLIGGAWQETDDPLLELVTVIYLSAVDGIYPTRTDIVGARDLKEGHFFQGPHALKVDSLIRRYGQDLRGFREACEDLKGEPMDMADAAYKLLPFPRIALYYLIWEGDEEFKPECKVLFDRSIEEIFAADAIWGLVTRVSSAILMGIDPKPDKPELKIED